MAGGEEHDRQEAKGMKKFFYLVLAVALGAIFLGSSLHAQQTLKIGVFDLQKIIRESKKIEAYRQELLKNAETKRTILRAKEESARQAEERLKKDGQRMSIDGRRMLEENLAVEVKELRRAGEDFDQEIQKMDRELTRKALKDIDVVVKRIAEKENFTVIFEKNAAGIVHVKDSVDITARIVKEL